MKLEHITWLDSTGYDGWHEPDDSIDVRCNSVGWVTAENEVSITLTGHINVGSGLHHADLCIPKCAIIERREM